MNLPPQHLIDGVDLLAKIGQFVFWCFTIWALITKRKDFLRSEITKKQLEELGQVRNALQSISFDGCYIKDFRQQMVTMNWNIETLKEKDREGWEQYQRYRNTSMELFYKFMCDDYYLFPNWVDKNKCKEFAKQMTAFAPFSLAHTASKSDEEIKSYLLSVASMRGYFDKVLKKHT